MRNDIKVLKGKAETLCDLSENKEVQQMASLFVELAEIIDKSIEDLGFNVKVKNK